MRAPMLLAPLLLFLAAPAGALTIDPNPVPYAQMTPDFSGTITLVDFGTGTPTGGVDLVGTTGAGDLVAVFFASHTGAPLVSIRVDAGSHLPSALGWIPGADVDLGASFGEFTFPTTGFLSDGETTDRFYVAYSGLDLGEMLRFTLASEGSTVVVTATVVPEPSSAAVLGLGLGVLALWRRRARSGHPGRAA